VPSACIELARGMVEDCSSPQQKSIVSKIALRRRPAKGQSRRFAHNVSTAALPQRPDPAAENAGSESAHDLPRAAFRAHWPVPIPPQPR
jgi:hypothetical protein